MTVWYSFEPTALRESRKTVEKLHPAAADHETDVDAASDPLRSRIEEAVAADRLDALIRELTPRERLLAVRCIVLWEDLRPAVVRVALDRPVELFVQQFWAAWESAPHEEVIREALAQLVETFGAATIHGGSHDTTIRSWMASDRHPQLIVQWLERNGILATRIPGPPTTPFRPESPLSERVTEWTLIHGTADQLMKIGPILIRRGWQRLSPDERMQAAARYLSVVAVDDWSEQLLKVVRETYGMPGRPTSIGRFWDMLEDDVVRAFRRHFVDRELARAFRDDTDRHRYWKKWGDQDAIEDVERGHASGTEWARLDFDGFSVVEFFEVGNAAYFYTPAQVRNIRWSGRGLQPADLKVKVTRPFPRFRDNRLIHNYAWQSTADQMVAAWSRRGRR